MWVKYRFKYAWGPGIWRYTSKNGDCRIAVPTSEIDEFGWPEIRNAEKVLDGDIQEFIESYLRSIS